MVSVSVKTGTSWATAATKTFTIEKLNIKHSINQEYQTAEFILRDTGTDWEGLDVGNNVIIEIDGTEEFRGYIKKIDRFYDGTLGLRVFCAGLSYDLYRYFTDEDTQYDAGLTTGTIVQNLINDYIPETWTQNITTATGYTVDDDVYFDTWKVGDAIANMASIDGYRFWVDWDSANSRKRINYVVPSTPASPLIFSDSESDSPDRLILDGAVYEAGDDIRNYVVVEGGKNFRERIEQTTGGLHVFNILPLYYTKVGQIFKAPSTFTNLDAVQVQALKTSSNLSDLKCRIYKALYNVAPDATVSANITPSTGANTDVNDEDTSTGAAYSVAASGTLEITYTFSSAVSIAYAYVNIDDFTDLDVSIQYSTDGTTYSDWETGITATGYIKKVDFTSAQYWKLKITNTGAASKTVTVNEFALFAWGYDSTRWNAAHDVKSLGDTNVVIPMDVSSNDFVWSGWTFFPKSVELTADKYYVMCLESYDSSSGPFYLIESSASDEYSDGQSIRHDSNGWKLEKYTTDLCFKLGFNYGTVRATSSNSTSISNYGQIPFRYTLDRIITYEVAKAVADYFTTEYASPNSYLNIEVEGINGLNLSEKVKVYLHNLSTSAGDLLGVDFEINSYEHEIVANRWRTYLELGKPSWKVYQIIANLNKGINTA